MNKIDFIVCNTYSREIRSVLKKLNFFEYQINVIPATCGKANNEDKILFKKKFDEIKKRSNNYEILISPGCSGILPAENNERRRKIFCPAFCMELFLQTSILNHFIEKNYYLVTPGWILHWKNAVIEKWKFDEQSAKLFFRESAKEILVIDTGIYENYLPVLNEFSEFVSLPYSILPVGLEYIGQKLENLIITRQIESKDAEFSIYKKEFGQKSSEFAMIFDVMPSLSKITSEETVIQQIFELYNSLFSPEKLLYFGYSDGIHKKTFTKNIDSKEANGYLASCNFEGKYIITDSKKGIIAKIEYHDKMLGYLIIDEILFPQYIDRYIQLELTISTFVGLLISNCRKYNELETAKFNAERHEQDVIQLYEEVRSLNENLIKKNEEYALLNEEYQSQNENYRQLNEELNQTNKILKVEEAQFRLVFEKSIDAIFWADAGTGYIIRCNSAALKMFECNQIDIIGKHQTSLHPVDKIEKYVEMFREHVRTKGAKAMESEIVTKSGKIKFVEVTSTIIKIGDVTLNQGIFKDITERKEAELKIKDQNLELKELNATKDKIYSIIAHDLRNPFNILLGFSDLLKENIDILPKEEAREYVQIINNTAKQTYNLLDNLLKWSSVQTGKLIAVPEKTNLGELIEDVCVLCKPLALAKNIKISWSKTKEKFIFADKEMITTVIRNLITNAIKFTHPQGKISITPVRKEKYYIVKITDSGIGIEENFLDKIFQLDSKLSKVGTADEKGTGLGLLLCREFIEKNGGKIWVESIAGSGSVFSFTVPVFSDL